jgi:hypothetical protein
MMTLGNKIDRVLRVDSESYSIKLRFADGTAGTVSVAHLFERPKGLAAEILRGGMFAMCFVENGALAWPNGFELCPDVLRAQLAVKPKRVRPATRSARIAK